MQWQVTFVEIVIPLSQTSVPLFCRRIKIKCFPTQEVRGRWEMRVFFFSFFLSVFVDYNSC